MKLKQNSLETVLKLSCFSQNKTLRQSRAVFCFGMRQTSINKPQRWFAYFIKYGNIIRQSTQYVRVWCLVKLYVTCYFVMFIFLVLLLVILYLFRFAVNISVDGLGRLAAWHLPGGPVSPPAGWAATSNVAGVSE